MTKKAPVPLSQKFPDIDPLALKLLESLIAFDPKDRPSAEEVGLRKHITVVAVCDARFIPFMLY